MIGNVVNVKEKLFKPKATKEEKEFPLFPPKEVAKIVQEPPPPVVYSLFRIEFFILITPTKVSIVHIVQISQNNFSQF